MDEDFCIRSRECILNLLSHDIPISSSKTASYHPWEMQVEIEVVAEVFELVKNWVPRFVVCHAAIARKNLSIAVCYNNAIFDKDWLAKITSLQGVIQASLKFFWKYFQNLAKMQHFQE